MLPPLCGKLRNVIWAYPFVHARSSQRSQDSLRRAVESLAKVLRGYRNISVREEQAKDRFNQRSLFGQKIRLAHAVGHQGILDALHWLNLSSGWVYPIHHHAFFRVRESLEVFLAKQGAQVYVPIALVLLPPIEINMKRRAGARFDQALSFYFGHLFRLSQSKMQIADMHKIGLARQQGEQWRGRSPTDDVYRRVQLLRVNMPLRG